MRLARRFVSTFASALLVAVLWSSLSSAAEIWPRQTVRLILPIGPGNATDTAARLYAERLAARWGQPVIVENRPGADGIPAVLAFTSARDHHTLLFSFAGPITINPVVHEKLPYDPARDLVPIAPALDNLFGIAVSATLPVRALDEFIALARAQPGKLNWTATPGLPEYIFKAFERSAGLALVHIGYGNFGPALQDLGEGRIQAMATGLGYLLPQIQAGKIRLLMVTNRERAPLAPDVPTAREAGFPELTLEGTVGFYGWRDMSVELRERIATDIRLVGRDPAIAARIAGFGSVARTGTTEEFEAAIAEQRIKIAQIAQRAERTR